MLLDAATTNKSKSASMVTNFCYIFKGNDERDRPHPVFELLLNRNAEFYDNEEKCEKNLQETKQTIEYVKKTEQTECVICLEEMESPCVIKKWKNVITVT